MSYANLDLAVTICQGLHGWKTWHKEEYDPAVMKIIGKKRTALWERVAADKKPYPMSAWEWAKEEIALKAQLSTLTKAAQLSPQRAA